MPALISDLSENYEGFQPGWPAKLWGPKYLAAIFAIVLSLLFFGFRSGTLIGDGLRHLPALRTISAGPPVNFEPKPWLEVYRFDYDRVVVRNHFLFALVMRTAYALERAVAIHSDVTIAMQVVNAISAGVAGGLFFLLLVRLGVPVGLSIAVTAGLCLSPFYLLAATNIAEVPLALPWVVGTLLVLASREFDQRSAMILGLLTGMATITYFLTGALVPCIAVAALMTRPFGRSTLKCLFLYSSVFILVCFGIWTMVLVLSGLHSPRELLLAITTSPQQGTYGGFKFGSILAVAVGLTNGFFPILPDDFRGLRFLYHEAPGTIVVAGMGTAIVCALLARAFYLLAKARMFRNITLVASALTFLLIEAVCIEFDPYYPKLQAFAVLLFWIIVAVGFANHGTTPARRWLLLLFIIGVCLSGVRMLRSNMLPSQTNQNAQQLHGIVGEGVLIAGWSSDVAHLWLYSNGANIISLPDFALARNLGPDRVQSDLQQIIDRAGMSGTNVYFYGVFDSDDADLINVYDTRFRLVGFTSYLRALQRRARPIAQFRQPANRWATLYVYEGHRLIH